MKASPAPVVSTTFTRKAGTCTLFSRRGDQAAVLALRDRNDFRAKIQELVRHPVVVRNARHFARGGLARLQHVDELERIAEFVLPAEVHLREKARRHVDVEKYPHVRILRHAHRFLQGNNREAATPPCENAWHP